jgi:hypothetical protein
LIPFLGTSKTNKNRDRALPGEDFE